MLGPNVTLTGHAGSGTKASLSQFTVRFVEISLTYPGLGLVVIRQFYEIIRVRQKLLTAVI